MTFASVEVVTTEPAIPALIISSPATAVSAPAGSLSSIVAIGTAYAVDVPCIRRSDSAPTKAALTRPSISTTTTLVPDGDEAPLLVIAADRRSDDGEAISTNASP